MLEAPFWSVYSIMNASIIVNSLVVTMTGKNKSATIGGTAGNYDYIVPPRGFRKFFKGNRYIVGVL